MRFISDLRQPANTETPRATIVARGVFCVLTRTGAAASVRAAKLRIGQPLPAPAAARQPSPHFVGRAAGHVTGHVTGATTDAPDASGTGEYDADAKRRAFNPKPFFHTI